MRPVEGQLKSMKKAEMDGNLHVSKCFFLSFRYGQTVDQISISIYFSKHPVQVEQLSLSSKLETDGRDSTVFQCTWPLGAQYVFFPFKRTTSSIFLDFNTLLLFFTRELPSVTLSSGDSNSLVFPFSTGSYGWTFPHAVPFPQGSC